jgi:hypothetical protein
MKNKAKQPKLENPKGRGFGVRKYEKLLPPCDTLDEQRRKLRRFPSYGTDELLAASRARLAQNSTLDDVIALGLVDKSQNALLCDFVMYARTLLEEKWTDSTEDPDVELARGGPFCR